MSTAVPVKTRPRNARARQLPFNPLAYGWDNDHDTVSWDYRPSLEYGIDYLWPMPCRCTTCKRKGDQEPKAGCIVTKEASKGRTMTLGYLRTLCPEHAA